jgi:uncharacterized protein (DUF433 family)
MLCGHTRRHGSNSGRGTYHFQQLLQNQPLLLVMSRDRSASAKRVVSRDPDVLSGELVFTGTRVPVQTLIDYLKAGETLDRFLDGFPTVEREQAEAYLEMTLKDAETHA